MTSPESEPGTPASRQLLTRRNLITSTGLIAAAVSAAPLLGQGTAEAAVTPACPPGTTAPVPPPAKGPAIPKSGYLVQEIGDRLFWLTDGLYQMIFMTTAEGVVAVDAPPTIGHNILRAIATVTTSRVTHAIYSHHHADHTGAMTLYQGARFYAQGQVAGLLRQARDPNRPLPDVTFDDQLTVDAGEDRVELAYHGPNHSRGNIFTYLPTQQVLMLVDVVFPGWVPFAYLAESQNIPGWLQAPAQALVYPFRTFIGGHLTRLGTRDDVVIQQEYVADLTAQAASAIDTFNVADVYTSVFTKAQTANTFSDRAAGQAAERALALAEPDRLVLPFAITGSRDLLEALPRHETAHAALRTEILDIIAGAPAAASDRSSPPPAEELSPGELRVLRYLPTNLARVEIASELSLSRNTVSTHIKSIYAKLGVRDRSSAVRRARSLRLLSAGRSEVRHLRLADIDADARTIQLGKRPHPVPLDPASWQVLQRCLVHREGRRTGNPHVVVTKGTKAGRAPASAACMSHVLDPCAVPPRMLRCTRLADLVNTMDPKLVAAAFGMNPEGVMIYPADHVDDSRLPGSELVR